MGCWLVKTEPQTYSWTDLVRDRRTVWDGVANPLALKNLRAVKKGDLVLIYHTGKERAVVGIAQAASDAHGDPAVVDLTPQRPLRRPVTLERIKADKTFAGWELVRLARLSVMPVPPAMWRRIEELSA
jgi:predicted RNA-binding protein with PUA-like domain